MGRGTGAGSAKLGHVRWIGGAPDAGKTTVARLLAARHGWQLYEQDRSWREHAERAVAAPARYPRYAAFTALTMDERWVRPTPEELVATTLANSAELFAMALDDLRALPPDLPILAEGPWFFPEFVAPLLRDPSAAIWLVPTPDFKRASHGRRKMGLPQETNDPERAYRNHLTRDLLLADHAERSARALGLAARRVDGRHTPDEMTDLVAAHFAGDVSTAG